LNLKERYEGVLADVARTHSPSGPAKLIVVTKNHPATLVAELVDLGCEDVGENRDQEASAKFQETSLLRPANSLKWHFIGQLQTNKVKSVLRYASAIHSIDRQSLVLELQKQLEKQERDVDGFIELNLTGDPGRGGVMPENLKELVEQVLQVPRIKLRGLMAVAGLGKEPRSEFEKVLVAQQKLLEIAPWATDLSMGMSEDYQAALEMGATHIRVGSKITGPRAY